MKRACSRKFSGLLTLFLAGLFAPRDGAAGQSSSPGMLLTNICQVRRVAGDTNLALRPIRLEGVVTWINAETNSVVIQDHSGAIKFETGDLPPDICPGLQVLLEGQIFLGHQRASWREACLLDYPRASKCKTNAIYLAPGRHRVHLEHYQAAEPRKLGVRYSGPGIPWQPIPDTWLCYLQGTNWEPGLRYGLFEANRNALSSLGRLAPFREGTAAGFDSTLAMGQSNLCIQLTGALCVEQAGNYTFSIGASDTRFVFDPPALRLTVLGQGQFPRPLLANTGWDIALDREYLWTEVEGVVTTVGRTDRECLLEVMSEAGPARVRINAAIDLSSLLPNSRVRIRGVGRRLHLPNAGPIGFELSCPSLRDLQILQLPEETWRRCNFAQVSGLLRDHLREPSPPLFPRLCHLQGTIHSGSNGKSLALEDTSGPCLLPDNEMPMDNLEVPIEALGIAEMEGTNLALRAAALRNLKVTSGQSPSSLVLTSVAQIRSSQSNGYPVSIRAVVTASLMAPRYFSVHDGTYGIGCTFAFENGFPEVGDYVQIEGTTYKGGFGPVITDAKQTSLGRAAFPPPVRADEEQLMNGSLDQQWVEVEGVVCKVLDRQLTLRTKWGDLNVRLQSGAPAQIQALLNASVRAIGVVMPTFKQHQVQSFYLIVNSCEFVKVEAPGTDDPFSAPLKRVSDWLYFDPKAVSSLYRVKAQGQVVHAGDPVCYLMDGTNGLRFTLQNPEQVRLGDVVEVVGYPEVGGVAPTLRDALTRSTGHRPLPVPRPCSLEDLLSGKCDSTLVRVEAVLVNQTFNRMEQILECRLGDRIFATKLAATQGQLPELHSGSLLGLTGVCSGGGRGPIGTVEIESLALLLNSPANVVVLAQPPWWTARHIGMVAGVLLAGLLVAGIWISLLRRQVEERTLQLGQEIRQRERAEHQRLMEKERTRIARDIHDELGAGLTQISLLSSLAILNTQDAEQVRAQSEKTGQVSRGLTRTLDEIVWAVRPQNDNLESVVEYLGQNTRELCEGSTVRCWFSTPPKVPAVEVPANIRHNLLLACREAVTNVLKHSRATRLQITLRVEAASLVVEILDNGCGFDVTVPAPNRNGLRNMRDRLAEIDGSCEVGSSPTGGTKVRIIMPFNPNHSPGDNPDPESPFPTLTTPPTV